MNNNKCKSCAHYHQHYALNHRRIFRVYCGLCTFSRAKKKLPDSNACANFVMVEPDEFAFATKEYLSKELLQYVLHLDLLPEINDICSDK